MVRAGRFPRGIFQRSLKPHRVIVLQHVAYEGAGAIADWAQARGMCVESYLVPQIEDWPRANLNDLVVVMGGPMGVYEESFHPWLIDEKSWLRKCARQGVRMLGICLGAQLLAEVLGGSVAKGPYREIGFLPVMIKPHAQLSFNLPAVWPVFHWHGDHIHLSSRCELLASSRLCSVQMYRFRNQILGLQCHPEISESMVREWVTTEPDLGTCSEIGVQSPEVIFSGCRHVSRLRRTLFTLLDRFFIDTGCSKSNSPPIGVHSV